MSRRTKTLLPMRHEQLRPAVTMDQDRQIRQKKLASQKFQDDVHAKQLASLQAGDTVRIKPIKPGRREWEEAIIVGETDEPPSKTVQTPTSTVCGNRRDLVKQPPKENAVKDTESAPSSLPDEQEEEELYSAVPSQATVTKTGRIIKRPEYYGNPSLYLIS